MKNYNVNFINKQHLNDVEYKKLQNFVYNWPTKHKEGFSVNEEIEILSKFPNINKDKYNDAMQGNTCHLDPDDGILVYAYDIFKGILCGLENRNLTVSEFD